MIAVQLFVLPIIIFDRFTTCFKYSIDIHLQTFSYSDLCDLTNPSSFDTDSLVLDNLR